MANRNTWWTAALLLAASVTASAQESVRSSHPDLRSLIARAQVQSQTFRQLSNEVNASDGLVYIESGRCRHGIKACLANVTAGGGWRILWVHVDTRKREPDLIASIGHELRHALEVLGDPTIRTYAGMYFFYLRQQAVRESGAFETTAAIEAGRAVRAEIRQN